ncbi:FAD-dependent oxidoreductase [Thiomicrorhabdus sp. zzn3]|uniref:NAD(P)/FAD-dependent oxidoreductase n=1 Tax=Thiomicrorhabdus sp. zzn3 TaxID=3039775 RepID=UPI00243644C7|nr:FAD-dependent oxidoreductase [Thiomicrorhabdus sp. zzn3]MDG6778305.1 FAD-dependent oxidoreductase [Thiomicrorhabdus sp. zzn3]
MGAGYAGWQVAEEVRANQPDSEITLLTACDGTVYAKPALSMALSQNRTADDLKEATAQEKAQQLDIGVKTNTKVISINTKRKKVMTTGGSFSYNKLVLATGARAVIPQTEGDAAAAIQAINDLAAYRRFRRDLENKSSVTIIGGGLIATEMAEDLITQDIEVNLVVRGKHLMGQLIPDSISDSLKESLIQKGVKLHFNTQMSSLEHCDTGYKLNTQNGEQIETGIVLAAVGLKPNIDLAKKAKLDTQKGICINEFCQTSDPDIYAIGDCSEFEGFTQAYLEPIRRQAKTIAGHINGDESTPFKMVPPLVKTKTPSLSIMVAPPLDSHHGNWELSVQAGNGQKLFYKDDEHVSGFALSGELVTSANDLYQKYFAA